MKLRKCDVSVERHSITGAWVVSALFGGRLVTRTYYGWTKREAVSDFVHSLNNGEN